MRRRLYGSLAVLMLLIAGAVLVTGATQGHCTIVCDWQVPLVVVGVGATLAAAVLAVVAVFYETGRVVRGRREGR